jgi:hypothetical protein
MIRPKGKIISRIRVKFNPNRYGFTEGKPGTPDFRIRKGLYAHNCYDHNELLIDETDPEFASCKCGCPDPRS